MVKLKHHNGTLLACEQCMDKMVTIILQLISLYAGNDKEPNVECFSMIWSTIIAQVFSNTRQCYIFYIL